MCTMLDLNQEVWSQVSEDEAARIVGGQAADQAISERLGLMRNLAANPVSAPIPTTPPPPPAPPAGYKWGAVPGTWGYGVRCFFEGHLW